MTTLPTNDASAVIDYDALVAAFNQALLHTLRKHSVADSFLDYWVPDADPVLGILSMIDSARIAGRTTLSIRFSARTVPEQRIASLHESAKRVGQAKLERADDHFLLHVTGMSAGGTAQPAGSVQAGRKPRYWSVGSEDSQALPGTGTYWTSGPPSEFDDSHPGLRAGLASASETIARERAAGPPGEGLVRTTATHNGTSLFLDIDPASHIVRSAWHSGGKTLSERTALDLFCRLAEKTPIQEVADHVGLNVIDRLVDDDKAPPVPGVLLPSNAGIPFQTAPLLARRAYDAYRAQRGLDQTTNFYVPDPAGSWLAMSTAERKDRLEGGLRAFLQSEQLYPDDIVLLRLEKSKTGHEVRSVVAFSDRIDVADKPPLLRKLEQRLRRDVERTIDIVADRARDKSPLRRLS